MAAHGIHSEDVELDGSLPALADDSANGQLGTAQLLQMVDESASELVRAHNLNFQLVPGNSSILIHLLKCRKCHFRAPPALIHLNGTRYIHPQALLSRLQIAYQHTESGTFA